MTDGFAEDVAARVVEGMPGDERSLKGVIRVAFKRETGMGREILADRSPKDDRVAREDAGTIGVVRADLDR